MTDAHSSHAVLAEEIVRVRAVNKELLTACELARDTLAALPDEIDVTEPFNKIEAAIASTWEDA